MPYDKKTFKLSFSFFSGGNAIDDLERADGSNSINLG